MINRNNLNEAFLYIQKKLRDKQLDYAIADHLNKPADTARILTEIKAIYADLIALHDSVTLAGTAVKVYKTLFVVDDSEADVRAYPGDPVTRAANTVAALRTATDAELVNLTRARR